MELEEAATLPLAYSTVYYSMVIRAGLTPGQSVLIHCGAGAVGTAAIQVALSRGQSEFGYALKTDTYSILLIF